VRTLPRNTLTIKQERVLVNFENYRNRESNVKAPPKKPKPLLSKKKEVIEEVTLVVEEGKERKKLKPIIEKPNLF
jgi:predicted transcriptional regulator